MLRRRFDLLLLTLTERSQPMKEHIRQRTKKLTVSAMLCALGVVLMGVGALIEVLDLSTAALASLLCIYAVIELEGFYPWMLWLGTSILALILLPIKTPALFYTFFLGYYPMLKALLERKCRRVLCWICKLLAFHLALGLIVLVAWAFFPALLESDGTPWQYPLLYALSLICFILYDVALTRFITFYLFKLRRMLKLK